MNSVAMNQATAALPNVPDPTVTRILDAAYLEFTTHGVRHTTMNTIAKVAGLGVATVYRRFPQRQRLVEAVLVREAVAVTAAVAAAMAPPASVEEQSASGFSAFARAITDRPLLVRLLRGDTDHDGESVAPGEVLDQVLAIARDWIAGWIRDLQEQGRYRSVDAEIVAEVEARLALSLIVVPVGRISITDDEATRAFARRYLVPMLGPEYGDGSPD